MPTTRSYGDACGIARALDIVGERWALLVVRELLLGPQRFTDLRRALPGASSNLIADRLRELEGRGVLRRRQLPAPAASRVYELTEWGHELEPVMLALGGWALDTPLPPPPVTLSATSVLLFLRGSARPDPQAPPATYCLELGGRAWTVRAAAGHVEVRPGAPEQPDAWLRTDPGTLNLLLQDPGQLGRAVSDGSAVTGGDRPALRRLLDSAARGPAGVGSQG